jgi:hypothetical protein
VSLKLTNTQKLNLQHLASDGCIQICTSVGRAFGSVIIPNGESLKSNPTSLNTFFAWGFFDEEEKYYHGLRYSCLTINEKGIQALVAVVSE